MSHLTHLIFRAHEAVEMVEATLADSDKADWTVHATEVAVDRITDAISALERAIDEVPARYADDLEGERDEFVAVRGYLLDTLEAVAS